MGPRWLIPGQQPALLIRDTLSGFQAGTEVQTHWLGGDGLAWPFSEGWTRLSDGEHIQSIFFGSNRSRSSRSSWP
ncbi:MAG: hypothetical protein NZ602_15490 [Thermoguttaceae bacterium]|nr:hypothetical protein [Thermoguttaceae bacterium]MDW8039503.1 hypothetical protein [Thermoguttaceae bacterium]